jgi:hypothetical protein
VIGDLQDADDLAEPCSDPPGVEALASHHDKRTPLATIGPNLPLLPHNGHQVATARGGFGPIVATSRRSGDGDLEDADDLVEAGGDPLGVEALACDDDAQAALTQAFVQALVQDIVHGSA